MTEQFQGVRFIKNLILKAVKSQCKIEETCHICGKVFRVKRKFEKHLEMHKKWEIPEDHVRCEKCKAIVHQSEINSHDCTVYPCQECGKHFGLSELKEHIKRYHEVDYLPCDICGAQFKTITVLKRHKESHQEKVPCEKCGKKIRARQMKEHMRAMHIGEMEDIKLKNPCPSCGKGLVQYSASVEKFIHTLLCQTLPAKYSPML